MALARPPAGKEAVVGAGNTGGMYHWAKGRPVTGSSTLSQTRRLDRVFGVVLSLSSLEQMENNS